MEGTAMLRDTLFLLRSRTAIELFWTYLVILIPTLALEGHYLSKALRGGAVDWAEKLLQGRHPAFFAGADLLEAGLLAGIALFSANILAGDRNQTIAKSIIFFLLLVMLANWISVKELSTLLTPNSLFVSISWVIDNPDHIKTYAHGRKELLIVAVCILSFLFLALLPAPSLGLLVVLIDPMIAFARQSTDHFFVAGVSPTQPAGCETTKMNIGTDENHRLIHAGSLHRSTYTR